MALDQDQKERLGALAKEIGERQRKEQWWQRVRVYDDAPPVPWALIDLTHPDERQKGPIRPKTCNPPGESVPCMGEESLCPSE
jgi:hypothetical protein